MRHPIAGEVSLAVGGSEHPSDRAYKVNVAVLSGHSYTKTHLRPV